MAIIKIWLCGTFENPRITYYKSIRLGLVIPGVTIIEFIMLHSLAGSDWIVLSFGDITIVTPLFIAALWIGNIVLEDFLYFVFMTLFGRSHDALPKLLHVNFKLHTKWSQITTTSVMLPRSYLTTPGWVAILLIAQEGYHLMTAISISIILIFQQVLYSLKVEKEES